MRKQTVFLVLLFTLLFFTACGKSNQNLQQTSTTSATSLPIELHVHQYTQTIVPPNCTDNGYTNNTCTCGETYKSNEQRPLGHSWQEPNCTSPKTCSTCGLTSGSKNSHTWVDATCTRPLTCANCGAIDGIPLEHRWRNATCSSAKKCINCSITEGSPKEHNWASATCSKPKTCTLCGTIEGHSLNHQWQKDGICSLCRETNDQYLKEYQKLTTQYRSDIASIDNQISELYSEINTSYEVIAKAENSILGLQNEKNSFIYKREQEHLSLGGISSYQARRLAEQEWDRYYQNVKSNYNEIIAAEEIKIYPKKAEIVQLEYQKEAIIAEYYYDVEYLAFTMLGLV